MDGKTPVRQRRQTSLSRETIVRASIELLDENGEGGLTFRALADRLATGPGAIYGHIEDRNDLLAAACDLVVAHRIRAVPPDITPEEAIRMLALDLFETIDAHPWVGPALTRAPGPLPIVRILERLGASIHALGVPDAMRWITISTLLNYILGVAGQNAINGQLARTHGRDRTSALDAMATAWVGLDPDAYPFTHGLAESMRAHEDRADFLAGIEIILRGIAPSGPGRTPSPPETHGW